MPPPASHLPSVIAITAVGERSTESRILSNGAPNLSVFVASRLLDASVADVGGSTEWDELEAALTTWSEQMKAEGRTARRAEELAEGRVGLLVSMTRQRLGEAVARTMSALLGSVRTESTLDEVGTWLLTCETGDAPIAKIRQI